MPNKYFAAIDLGTNSCRLVIADEKRNYVYKDTRPVRLGEGMAADMRFTPEAMQRGFEALADFQKHICAYNCCKVRAVATAACRMAGNGMDFVHRVAEQCGLQLEVIDGAEEARLNLKGAVMNSKGLAPYVVVYDLGGGSTEITLATNDAEQKILYTVSIPWGARNAAETFGLEDIYDEERAEKLRQVVKAYTDDFKAKSGYEQLKDKCCAVATSSNPLRLSAWIHQRGEYVREREDGQVLQVCDMDRVIAEINAMSREEREKCVYIGSKRAPIFLAAGVIFKTIYDELGLTELMASLKSAKDGIIEELAEEAAHG